MGFWDGSAISWTICKQSAPHSRQITIPSHNFYRPDALPDARPTVSKHWRNCRTAINKVKYDTPTRPEWLGDFHLLSVAWHVSQMLQSMKTSVSGRRSTVGQHRSALYHTAANSKQSGSLQASSDSSPVSQRPRNTVSVGALHPGLQCWHAAASAFRQPSPTCRTAFLAQHLRPSGVLSCWPDGLELTPGFYPGSNEQHRLF